MIEANRLVKTYGPTRAVSDVSFRIERGEIVGFLGPNGAGKTTTLRILTGYLPPTAGEARIDGHHVMTASSRARASLGYLPETNPLYPEMRVEAYLDFRGRLLEMPRAERQKRIDHVCDRCGLLPVRRRTIGRLSKGNRQRVGLAQALLHDPPVLILDEPTAGLDPNQVSEVRKLITELRGEHTVLLSTHILPEVEKTADRVLIIAGGRIAAEGTPEALRRHVASGANWRVEVKASPEAAERAARGIEGVAGVEAEAEGPWTRLEIIPAEGAEALAEKIGQTMLASGWRMRHLSLQGASLEKYFIEITARQDQPAGSRADAPEKEPTP